MDMREYIVHRLDGMKSVTEKNMLRDVMEEIFIPMYDHMEERYEKLERRVREEMPLKTSQFVIWNTLMERENADGGCPYLFPLLPEDMTKPEIELAGLADRLRSEREIRLDTVFLQADYLDCRAAENSGTLFPGTLKTENGDIPIGVRLRLSKRYSACVENLYRLFISNAIPWQTVNSPHVFKMFDVVLVRAELNGGEAGISGGYDVSFGKLNGSVKRGLVPVWNICRLRIKSDDFPLAALDKVNYEYGFDISAEGPDNGYLADYGSADISAVRREDAAIIVTTPSPKGIVWDMYKVVKRRDYVTDYFPFELLNNAQDDSFAARMTSFYGTVIKTNTELRRILASYDVSQYVSLDSAQVVSGQVAGETYEVNNFLRDEIRDLAVSKSLLLKFKPVKRGSYILRDMMSFLVSQVQIIYPEFHCVGVLV